MVFLNSAKNWLVITFLCCLIVPVTAHTQHVTGAGVKQKNSSLILYDVAYGKDPFQKMDVYLVDGRTIHTPVAILIHGGGWMAGDKRDADFMKELLYSNSINVININYRLANDSAIHCREMILDIEAAISFFRKNSNKWTVKKDNYVLWGGSAGAHLALLYAYNFDKKKVVAAVITLGAPTKLNEIRNFQKRDLGLLKILTSKEWEGDTTDITFRNPSPYYGKHLKPTLLVHGEADSIVSIEQSVLMIQMLREKGVPHQFFPLPDGAHGGQGTSTDVVRKLNETLLEWVKKYSH